MSFELKDGVVLKNGAQIGVHNAETNIVLVEKPVAPPDRKSINALFEVKPTIDVNPENKPQVQADKPAKAAKDIPPEPKTDPSLGDRTPAWAEWCRQYDPKRFAEHFHDLRPYDLNAE